MQRLPTPWFSAIALLSPLYGTMNPSSLTCVGMGVSQYDQQKKAPFIQLKLKNVSEAPMDLREFRVWRRGQEEYRTNEDSAPDVVVRAIAKEPMDPQKELRTFYTLEDVPVPFEKPQMGVTQKEGLSIAAGQSFELVLAEARKQGQASMLDAVFLFYVQYAKQRVLSRFVISNGCVKTFFKACHKSGKLNRKNMKQLMKANCALERSRSQLLQEGIQISIGVNFLCQCEK